MRGPVALGVALLTAPACADGDPVVPEAGDVTLELVVDGLTSPVALAESPDGTGRLFVADQPGRIRVVSADGQLLQEPFLDLRSRMLQVQAGGDERGLLGLAFHPGYATNGRFFVYYSAPRRAAAPASWNHTSHVSEFVASDDPEVADAASERVVLQVDQPQANHNGGALAFGPDGMLYVSLGDGGGANDGGTGHSAEGNGQDPGNLLGSVLRIDVDGGMPYRVPQDNPFVGQAGFRPEIYAYGFRNPYRISFDRLTGDLLAGDVGQNLYEEVDRVIRGGNYGWNRREGAHCFDPDRPNDPPASCATTGPFGEPLRDPVLEYGNARGPGGLGVAVVGGYVYRGSALPDLVGAYVFGDFSHGLQPPGGRVFLASPSPAGSWSFQELGFPGRPGQALGHYLKGFGEDVSGEIYLLTTDQAGPSGSSGRVYRLAPADP